MDVFDAIYQRHSVDKVKPDEIARDLVEKLLGAAVQAPNHYKVRPWRFVVLTGVARNRLGDVMAESVRKKSAELSPEALTALLEVERSRPLRSPLLIAVGVDKPEEARVVEVENICAAAAAVQNLLLAAHALGLGAKWRTGGPAYDADVKQFLGFSPDQHLIGFLYIGYPERESQPQPRQSYEDRTAWMD